MSDDVKKIDSGRNIKNGCAYVRTSFGKGSEQTQSLCPTIVGEGDANLASFYDNISGRFSLSQDYWPN